MTLEQALALLAARLGPVRAGETERDSALALAEAVGYLPLALELAAAQVASGVPWTELLEDLHQEVVLLKSLDDVSADEVRDKGLRKRLSLRACFQLSLHRLSSERRGRFAWLGVLPDDVSLTSPMCATLWGMRVRETRRTLHYLQDKALLQRGAPQPDGTTTYQIHDLLHYLARHLLTAPTDPTRPGDLPGLELTLPEAHTALLARYRAQIRDRKWHTLPPDGYVHSHLAWHMEKAGQDQELHALLREESVAGRNGWYRARERLGQTAGYVQDVERAWRVAERADAETIASGGLAPCPGRCSGGAGAPSALREARGSSDRSADSGTRDRERDESSTCADGAGSLPAYPTAGGSAGGSAEHHA